ncbi:hypothetical protein E2C01_093819 [Portunus trituberculatus]|uniref:Uncharacterized protein n=1 Tax=Portunus trituberculatus TaxID=210409 RepID=A0A5B7JZR8_PORTR|nr:hypothetical protein [Portunus trituberculatus]
MSVGVTRQLTTTTTTTTTTTSIRSNLYENKTKKGTNQELNEGEEKSVGERRQFITTSITNITTTNTISIRNDLYEKNNQKNKGIRRN